VNRRQIVAVVVGVAAMLLALGPPLWVRATGSEHTLAIRPVDPLSLFRGNYMDVRYDVDVPAGTPQQDDGALVYAVFADERPGRLVRITPDKPDLADAEFCLRARRRGSTLEFPNLEQFYVSAARAREFGNLRNFLAVVDVTASCRAVLVDLEPR
jgi:hypothetical protein